MQALLARLPRGTDPVVPAEPPPLSPDALLTQLDDVDPRRDGLGRKLLPRIDAALGERLQQHGEVRIAASPWQEAALYRGGDADTFAGRPAGPQDLNPAERTILAAAWARAASEILEEEPHARRLLVDVGGVARVTDLPAGGPSDIGLIDRHLGWVIPSPAGREIATIAAELGAARSSGHFRRITAETQMNVPMVVVTDRRPLQLARHAHRTNGLQGPWGCIAKSSRSHHAPPLELLAGTPAAIDTAEQARLAIRIFERADQLLEAVPEGSSQWLGREMTRTYVDAWRPPEWGFDRTIHGLREELFTATRDALPGDVAELAWAFGVALHQLLLERSPSWRQVCQTGGGRSLGPGIVVPLREAGPPDAAVLTAVRFAGDSPESLSEFAARFAEQAAREREGRGLLGDALRKGLRQSAPPEWRSRLYRAIRDGLGPVPGPFDWIGGAARVDLIEIDGGWPWPVYSGTSPSPGLAGLPWTGGISLTATRIADGSGSLTIHGIGDLGRRTWGEDLALKLEAALG